MKKEYNFDEFESMSKMQWANKLNQDLGADLAKRVSQWTSERGLSLAAYYHKDDVIQRFTVSDRKTRAWKYLQPLYTNNKPERVHEALMNGADGIIMENSLVGEFNNILKDVAPQYCTLAMRTADIDSYKKIIDWLNLQNLANNSSEFLLINDYNTLDAVVSEGHLSFLEKTFDLGERYGHQTINIDCGLIQKLGGSVQLELAYLLSQSVYFVNHFLDQGYPIESIACRLLVSTAVGPSYFLELSKIRVVRLLMSQLLKQYGLEGYNVPVHATTSPLSKSALDKNTNFLRCTSEATSAVLGGVDYLTIEPYHDLQSTDRIARNISNLLKDESALALVGDPASGSYYLECLTQELAKLGWQTFQELEKKGGFKSAVEEGFFEREVTKDFDFQKSRIAEGRRKIVGVNDFGNQEEQISTDSLVHDHPSLSEDFEQIRRQIESHVLIHGDDQRPIIYLLAVGLNVKMINARFTFVTNFFSWAGFSVKSLMRSEKPAPGSVVVCCGGDEDYTDSKINEALDSASEIGFVLAAGRESKGSSSRISAWVNAKTNRLEGVKNVLKLMGISKSTGS